MPLARTAAMGSGPNPLVTAINATSRPPAASMRWRTRATLAATTAASITPGPPSLQEGRNIELVVAAGRQIVVGVRGEEILAGIGLGCLGGAGALAGRRLGAGAVPPLE